LDCLKTRHAVNIIRIPWAATPSLFIPDTTYPKEPLLTKPSFLRATSRTRRTYRTPVDRSISLGSISTPACTCVHTHCPCRRCRGMDQGQPLTDPSPDSGHHPAHLFPIPLLGGELPDCLQIRARAIKWERTLFEVIHIWYV
jgi:hypothetical protein